MDVEERREDHQKWRANMEDQIESMNRRLTENTALTTQTKVRVDEVHEILEAAKGAFRFFSIVGKVAKWCGVVAAAVTAVWVTIYQITHNGSLPK